MAINKLKTVLKIFISIVIFCLIGVGIFYLLNIQKEEQKEPDFVEIGGYVEIEPDGICEHKGMVQVRLNMYLYPGDYGYEKHYVQIPVIPVEGYSGEIDKDGRIINTDEYENWINNLPKTWVNNPFHNHFIYIEPTMSDEEIMDIAEIHLKNAYNQWSVNEKIDLKNPNIIWPLVVDSDRLAAVEAKIQHLKTTILIRQNTLLENEQNEIPTL